MLNDDFYRNIFLGIVRVIGDTRGTSKIGATLLRQGVAVKWQQFSRSALGAYSRKCGLR